MMKNMYTDTMKEFPKQQKIILKMFLNFIMKSSGESFRKWYFN